MASSKAGVYVRISRDAEAQGLGLARQLEDCRELAATLGWEIVDTYSDNDRSAFSGRERPEYRRLLADLEAGRITGVIAWHPDRLHRSPLELEEYVDLAQRRSVDTHTVRAGGWDLSTPAGRLQARVIGSFSRYESEHKSDRVARAHEQIAVSGGYRGGRRPYGWEPDGMTLRATEAAVVADATRSVLQGHSLRSVITRLNADGILTAMGKEWTPTRLRDTLLRPRNAGLSVHRGEIVGAGQWEAIVSEDEWRACCSILSDPTRTTTPQGGGQVRWLGSGLYVCGLCGSNSIRVTRTTHGYPVYRCLAGQNRGGKVHLSRQAEPLDEYVSALIVGRLSMPDARDLFTVDEDQGKRLDDLRTERAALDERLAEAGRMFADGEIDRAALAKITGRITPRLDELDASLADLSSRSPLAAMASGEDIAETWRLLDLDRKRAILDALLEVTILRVGGGRRAAPKDGSRDDVEIRWKA